MGSVETGVIVRPSRSAAAAFLESDTSRLAGCDTGNAGSSLVFWESPRHFVVLGFGRSAGEDVDREECEQLGIPVLRRTSGGGTVLQGPGCVNYSLVFPIPEAGPLRTITGTTEYVLRKIARALEPLVGRPASIRGQSDLVIGDRKFSGSAQRRTRNAVLYHGTILLGLDLELVERVLRVPKRQPDYRQGRSHKEFLLNLNLPAKAVTFAIAEVFGAAPLHYFDEYTVGDLDSVSSNK